MPAKTTQKGEIGEAMVIADLIRQGHDVAIPFGHNQPFDRIVIRKENGRLEKIQVKYATSDGRVIVTRVESSSAWVRHKYTVDEVDWLAIYEPTTGQCFYLPPEVWGDRCRVNLRLTPPLNGQKKGIRYAHQYAELS
jgi:hypothetical protein